MTFEHYSLELSERPYEPLSNSTLIQLWARAYEGDRGAWERLWEHGLRMVLKMVNHMDREKVLRHLDREEAIAVGNAAIGEALLSWLPKLGAYSTWVWVGVRRAILAAERQAAEAAELVEFDEAFMGQDGEGVVLEHEVSKYLAKLPEPIQHYMNLHYLRGMSQQDIAAIEGVTRQRVNQLITQGIEELRKQFMID